MHNVRPPFRRTSNFTPLCYEIPVVLDFTDIATDEELDGEPFQQQALLLSYRESGRMRVIIWAHETMFSDWTFEARYTDSAMGNRDRWDHRRFCEYLEFLSSWEIGKPIFFTEDASFDPVPAFSQKAQEIIAYSDFTIPHNPRETVH